MDEKQKGLNLNSQPQHGPKGCNYLLAIAINEYQHCSVLNNAVHDVETFITVLINRYNFDQEHIIFIKNQEATKKRIEQEFIKLTKKIKPEDNLIVYFSGHGRHDEDLGGNWVPVEAGATDEDWPDYLSNDLIKSYLNRINSFHTFLIADSCFSGSLFIDKSKEKFTGDRRETEPSRWGLTSGKKEIVSDGNPGEHSPFAAALINVLQKADKAPSVMHLCDLVLEKVAANARQTPMGSPLAIKGHQGGQFVFHFRTDENADWEVMQSSAEGCRRYLNQYPEGKYRRQAELIISKAAEDKAWQATVAANSVRALLNFEKQFPESNYISSGEVDLQIARIEEEELWRAAVRSNSVTAYRDYLRRTSQGKYSNKAGEAISSLLQSDDEATLWKKARVSNSKESYETYLGQYPNGLHAASAKAAIVEFQIEQEEKARREKDAEALRTQNRENEEAEARRVKAAEEAAEEEEVVKVAQLSTSFLTNDDDFYFDYRRKLQKKRATIRLFMGVGGAAFLILSFLGIRYYLLPSKKTSITTAKIEVFQKNGKFGYRDATGETIIPADYDSAGIFLNGEARVMKNGHTFTIDKNSNCIADCPEGLQSDVSVDAKPYLVKCGAFKSTSNAQSLVTQLKNLGYKNTVITEDETDLISVIVDRFSKYQDAVSLTEELKTKGIESIVKNENLIKKRLEEAASIVVEPLVISPSFQSDNLIVKLRGGTMPYRLALLKNGEEKYSVNVPVESGKQHTINVAAFRKDPGKYELLAEDANGQKTERSVTIKSKKQFDNALGFGIASLENGWVSGILDTNQLNILKRLNRLEIEYANCSQSCSYPVENFTITYQPRRQDPISFPNTGLIFSDQTKSKINSFRNHPGTLIIIDFNNRKINNLFFEIQYTNSTIKTKNNHSPATFAKIGEGNFDIGSSAFREQPGVEANLANCMFDCNCTVKSFDITYLAKRQDPVKKSNTGASYSADVVNLVSRAKPGDFFFFTNIIVTCTVDGKSKTLEAPPLVYRIR